MTTRTRRTISKVAMSLLLACGTAMAAAARSPQASPGDPGREAKAMKIRIELEDRTLTATLADGEAARDFASLLPLTLTLTDYNSTEKIADLPRKLSTKGAPAGVDPEVGDIAYYAPWGNLAIFYRDFGYSSGLVKLAHLDSGVEALGKGGPVRVTIERDERP